MSPRDVRRPELPAPVGFQGLLAASFSIFRELFRPLILCFLGLSAAAVALRIASRSAAGAMRSSDSLVVGLGTIGPIAFQVTLMSLGVAIAAVVVADHIAGNPVSLGAALRSSRPLWKELVAAALFAALIALGVSVLLAFVTLFFISMFYGPTLAAHAVALEAKPLQFALARARELARGQWLRIIPFLFCIALGLGLVAAYGQVPVALVVRGMPESVQIAAFLAGRIALDTLTGAFFAVVSVILYFDLRARAEDYGPAELKAERASSPTPD